MPIATSALIGAGLAAATTGASIASSSLNSHASRKAATRLQNQQNEFNAQQAQLNRQYMEDYYNKYDSPSAMMRQYREAGLNPYSYNGSTGSMGASMGNAPMMDNTAQQSAVSQAYANDNTNRMAAINNAYSQASSTIALLEQIEDLKQKRIETNIKSSDYSVFSNPIYSEYLPYGISMQNKGGFSLGQLASIAKYGKEFGNLIESDSSLGSTFDPLKRLAYLYETSGVASHLQSSPEQLDGMKFAFNTLFNALKHNALISGQNLHAAERDNKLRDLGINPDGQTALDSLLRFAFNGANDNSGINALQDSIGKWLNSFADTANKLVNFELPGINKFKKKTK